MAQTLDKWVANNKATLYDFDPDGTDATDIAWVDMQDYEGFTAFFFRTVGTGALDTFSILGNAASDGSGTDVTVVTHAVGSEPDAVGDWLVLECSAQQIAQEAADAGVANVRYVSVSAEFATGTDEGVIVYIRHTPKRPQDGLTADTVA